MLSFTGVALLRFNKGPPMLFFRVRNLNHSSWGGGTVNIFDLFDRISDLDEKCLYSAKNVYTSKDLKKISPSLKNVYIL